MAIRRLRDLPRDRGGVAALEFGLTLPLLCAMVFSLYEVSQGVICYMKVTDVANTVSDLVAQTTSSAGGVGNTDFDNLYIAGKLVMTPNSGSGLKLAIASVTFNSTGGSPTVAWHAERGGASAQTDAATNAAGLGSANGSVIAVRATYTYSSLLNYFITSPITINAQVFAQPRQLAQIPCPPPSSAQSCG